MNRKLLSGLVLAIIAGAGLAGWLIWHNSPAKPASPVPQSISSAVSFPVYYPDQSKLPDGYTLDTSSFRSPVKDGVNYTVNYGGGKKLVFSLQIKPSDSELNTFSRNYIPLKNEFRVEAGRADVGVYNNETLVSLPIAKGPWIIITAPKEVNQSQLKQVLQSLKKD